MLAAPSTCICKTPTVRVSRRSSPVAAAIGTSARLHASETASAASAAPGCSRQSSLKTRAWRDIACRARCNLSSVAASAAIASSTLSLGIDCGTSGARAILIDGGGKIVHESQIPFDKLKSEDWVGPWTRAFLDLLKQLPQGLKDNISSLCIDGTSSTALLVDSRRGDILAPTKIYNEDQGAEAFEATKAIAPEWHCARGSTSTLAKLINWHNSGTWQQAQEDGYSPVLLHHADWLASLLTGRRDTSDWNNTLKLGYDPEAQCYPDWLLAQPYAGLLPPRVLEPGKAVGTITDQMAKLTGLPKVCTVCAGTSDSTSAFIAAGVQGPGEAVTSLGSTFAPKLLSKTRVDNAFYGVYSQRIGDSWLVGGASNTGGAVLKEFFTSDQLTELSAQIDPDQPSGLDYYPLTKPGERFPVNDPHLEPRLTPRPDSDVQFLHGMLEGMANIEARAYGLLRELGAAPLTKVYTAGGGSKNSAWLKIRERKLGVPVVASTQVEAAYGSALLAQRRAAMPV